MTGQPSRPLPPGIGPTATRALTEAGYTTLDDLVGVSAKQLVALHGVGPKAIRLIRQVLAESGDVLAD